MKHSRYAAAKTVCILCAAVLAAGLVCAVLSCDGIGSSVNSDGGLYGGTSGDSGSGGMGGSGGSGSGRMKAGGNTFTVEDLISLSNAGNTEAIIELLSGSGENEAVGTFMVVLPAADIGLPAGGSVILSITGDGYNYYEVAQDAGNGIVSFEAPCIAVGTTVTVTLEVRAADGSIAATGTKTQLVTEGVCNFHVTMVDTAPAPVPAGFVAVTGGTVSGAVSGSDIFIAGRTVTIRNLYVCAHEVTQEEYTAVMGSNPSNFNGSSGKEPAAGEVQEKRPVEKVSWYDALVYCNRRSMAEGLTACYTISGSTDPDDWGSVPTSSNGTWNAATCNFDANGYRLPTEAEWEYAARGGNGGIPAPQTTYSGSDTPGDVAWYSDNSGDGGGSTNKKTHEVMKKAPNSLGLYDMSGNVYEWCWDRYSSSVSGSTPDTGPAGPSSNRVNRGGSWNYGASCCAVSYRFYDYPSHRSSYQGFRLVRSAD